MKVTLKVTHDTRQPDQYGRMHNTTETVVDVEGIEFSRSLTASFLRATADEIDPPRRNEEVTDVRPLVVLDLEALPVRPTSSWRSVLRQWEQIARRDGQRVDADVLGAIADQIEAQTRPPKPPEPQGLGAVVKDQSGCLWVRAPRDGNSVQTEWVSYHSTAHHWSAIDAVEVLAEGVAPARAEASRRWNE